MERLTKSSFSEKIWNLDSEKIITKKGVIIKFFVDNCDGCDIMKPIFEILNGELIEFDFYEMKAGSDLRVAKKFDIEELPAFICIKPNGKFIKLSGQMPKIILSKQINNFFNE